MPNGAFGDMEEAARPQPRSKVREDPKPLIPCPVPPKPSSGEADTADSPKPVPDSGKQKDVNVYVSPAPPPPPGPKKPDSMWGMVGQVYGDLSPNTRSLLLLLICPLVVIYAFGMVLKIDFVDALVGRNNTDPDLVERVQTLQGVLASSQTTLNQISSHLNTMEARFNSLEDHQILVGRWVCDKEGMRYVSCEYRYIRPAIYQAGPREVQGTSVTISPNTAIK